MDYFPNVDAACYFADQILPRIQDACPDAVFQIVGRNPSRRVRDLARRKNVEVTGRVPDVRPYVAGAAVFRGAVPGRSGNPEQGPGSHGHGGAGGRDALGFQGVRRRSRMTASGSKRAGILCPGR